MSKNERKIVAAIAVISAAFSTGLPVQAMHIMEGYLPLRYCIFWGVLCLPFLAASFFSIKKTIKQHRKTLLLFAMMGAYVFVLSALKIPSVTGSSSHPTGMGLGAVLFGPMAMGMIGLLVLLFQALLLAHGGLTTLGANTFSMAVCGPLVSFFVYRFAIKCRWKKAFAVFLAACLGNLFTYCVTSLQLALAHPSETGGVAASAAKFFGIFALTQIPLAIIEGILSAIVIMGLETYAKPELKELGYWKEETV